MDKQVDTTTPTPPAEQIEAVAAGELRYYDGSVYWKHPDGSHRGLTSEDVETINLLFKASGAEHVRGLVAKNEELRDALLDMVWQFCSNGWRLNHMFLSAGEYAFDVLGLENGMTYEEAEAASKEALSRLPEHLKAQS